MRYMPGCDQQLMILHRTPFSGCASAKLGMSFALGTPCVELKPGFALAETLGKHGIPRAQYDGGRHGSRRNQHSPSYHRSIAGTVT